MVEAALIVLGLVAGFGWARAVRLQRVVDSIGVDIAKREEQPAERHVSPARYLYACSQRLGVSTQSLKDLGFTPVHEGDNVYRLESVTLPPDLEVLAREAMGEIAAECRPIGNRVQVPATSYRWIAKACRDWEEQIEERRVASVTHRVDGTWS